uniref:Uncharacterized protein n=1 Tax=Vitis vinifera TaxID=29760 RepID=F6I2K7_VITVI
MVYTGRILAVSYSPTTSYRYSNSRFHQGKLKSDLKWRAMVSGPEASAFAPSVDSESADKNDTGNGNYSLDAEPSLNRLAKLVLSSIFFLGSTYVQPS